MVENCSAKFSVLLIKTYRARRPQQKLANRPRRPQQKLVILIQLKLLQSKFCCVFARVILRPNQGINHD